MVASAARWRRPILAATRNLTKFQEECDSDFSPDDLLGTLIGNY